MPHDPRDWRAFKKLIATPDLPDLGPRVRSTRLSISDLNQLVERFVADPELSPDLGASLRSAALLWHDHLDESHEISQEIHTRDGSFLHGIMHRREPDYGNAKHWFNRVGNHPAYSEIGIRVKLFLEAEQQSSLLRQLIPRAAWDPFAFVDACEQAACKSGETTATLQAIQEIEFDSLLEHLLHS
jgi:hypothetical protein